MFGVKFNSHLKHAQASFTEARKHAVGIYFVKLRSSQSIRISAHGGLQAERIVEIDIYFGVLETRSGALVPRDGHACHETCGCPLPEFLFLWSSWAKTMAEPRSTWSSLRYKAATKLFSIFNGVKNTSQAPRRAPQVTEPATSETKIQWFDTSSMYTLGYIVGVILMASA